MTRIILMRHGETVSNVLQIYQGQGNGILSEKGIGQAKAASAHLKGVRIDAVYCSDLVRAKNTAEIVARPHKLKVRTVRQLRERFYGSWEGLKFDEIKDKWPALYKKWLVQPNKAKIPGAETLKELQTRGVKALESIIRKNKGRTVLVVGHGGLNRGIIFHYLGLDLNSFWRIKQDNCCMNIIDHRPPAPRVVLINSTCFLGENRLKDDTVLA